MTDGHTVPGGAEPVPNASSITKGQLFTLVFAFLLRHCCTEVAAADLILLLNTLVPGCMPHNMYFFKKLLKEGVTNHIDTHGLCSYCGDYLCEITSNLTSYTCTNCKKCLNINELIKSGHTFLTYSIENQLKNLCENMKIGSKLVALQQSDGNLLNDIHDGSEYRQLNVKFPDSLSLTCNTDGIPAFASSNTSLWPIYFVINELPLALRPVYMMLAALWSGPSKPRLESLFKPVVNCLEKLHDTGFVWVNNGRLVTTKVYMCLVTCDSVARPLLQNFKQFNGHYGCGFCYNEGTVVEKGLGYVRSYVEPEGGKPPERTHAEIMTHAQMAVEQCSCVFGVKGPSILALVPGFNLSFGFVPEYMHSVLLGVVRQFLFLWFDSTSHSKPYYLGRKISDIDNTLLEIKPPSTIKRLPRSLTYRKYWKASEWRNFLLFYSPIVLKPYFPREFFRHWCLLVFAIFHLMLTPVYSNDLLLAERALNKFVARISDLYGVQHISFNVHLLTHLVPSVRRWGPLWSHSAFCFEDANGKLLTFFHGTRGVTSQIFRSFLGATHLRKLVNTYVTDSSAVVLDRIVNMASFCKNAFKLENVVCLGHPVRRSLSASEVVAIESIFSISHWQSIEISAYQRIVINGTLLHTRNYSRSTRTNDSYFYACSKAFLLANCIVIQFCSSVDCCINHNVQTEVVFLAHPISTTTVQNVDTDINANLSVHIQNAVVDYDAVCAVKPSDFCRKLFMLSDHVTDVFLMSLPRFELD